MAFPKVVIRPRRSMAFFALLSIVMVVGTYIFVILLAAACVYLPYLVISSMETPDVRLILLFLFGIVIAGAMLWSLLPRRDKFKAPGMLLDCESQPRLFAELESIASSLEEPMPREVYLIGDVNAWVADRGGFMGFGSRRVMGLGLPLLAILTVSQFRAVLAHEFAHYYGGDISLGLWVHKTQRAMVRIFENIGSVSELARIAILGIMYTVVATLMKWYFQLFLRAINLASRQREYRADELACLIAGRQPLIDGLRAIHGADMAWPAYWNSEVSPVLSDGGLPGIGEGFARFIAVPSIDEQISKNIHRQLQETKQNPYDTHPPLRDRIEAVEKLESAFVAEDAHPARHLLEHIERTELHFLEAANPDMKAGTLQLVSWDEVAEKVTLPAWKKFTQEYASALEGVTAGALPDQIPKLLQVGSKMRDPKGMLLGPEQRTQRAAFFFGAALALALVERGWKINLQPGILELSAPSDSTNIFPLFEQMMSGKLSAQGWIAKCQQLGIADVELSSLNVQQMELLNPKTTS